MDSDTKINNLLTWRRPENDADSDCESAQAPVQERQFPAKEREHASHCSGNFHSHCPQKAEGYRGDTTCSRSPGSAEPELENASLGPQPKVMGLWAFGAPNSAPCWTPSCVLCTVQPDAFWICIALVVKRVLCSAIDSDSPGAVWNEALCCCC